MPRSKASKSSKKSLKKKNNKSKNPQKSELTNNSTDSTNLVNSSQNSNRKSSKNRVLLGKNHQSSQETLKSIDNNSDSDHRYSYESESDFASSFTSASGHNPYVRLKSQASASTSRHSSPRHNHLLNPIEFSGPNQASSFADFEEAKEKVQKKQREEKQQLQSG